MTRKAELEKALAFDEFAGMKNDYVDGRLFENRRLASLHAVLLESVENLEDIQAWCRDRDASKAILYAVCLSRSTEALAKIDKALGEVRMTRKEKQGEGT